MTRQQQKAYNAENYPASVLTWLNEATDRAFDEFESASCENCKWLQDSTCVNDDSQICWDYPDIDMMCNKWEKKDESKF